MKKFKQARVTGGGNYASQSISSLAFADDLILLADNHATAQTLLTHKELYLKKLGMSIAAHKCTSFRVVSTKDSWYISDTNLLLVGSERIPSSAADTRITYLGGHISPWSGLQHDDLIDHLRLSLHRLRSAPLKPHQKLNLLTAYILPHFLYTTILAIPPITTIRDLDSLIRTHVKDILHLPACTPNGLLYCGKRDGSLGIPKMETLATTTALKQ